MRAWWAVFSAVATLAVPSPAFTQPAETPPPAMASAAEETVPPAPSFILIPADTVVQVELTEALSSRTSQQEQLFGLRLAEPIVIDGQEVVAAGAVGGGEVIDAHPSAFGGRQGRLIISGRFIEIDGGRQRIRGMQIMTAGEQRTNTALAVSMIPYAGIAGIFVQGGEVDIPVGARGTARLANDVQVPLTAVAPLDAAPLTEAAPQALEGENQ